MLGNYLLPMLIVFFAYSIFVSCIWLEYPNTPLLIHFAYQKEIYSLHFFLNDSFFFGKIVLIYTLFSKFNATLITFLSIIPLHLH